MMGWVKQNVHIFFLTVFEQIVPLMQVDNSVPTEGGVEEDNVFLH